MIDSGQNKIAKLIKSLENRKYRDKEKLFTAEGLRFTSEIPNDYEILFYAVSETYADENDAGLLEKRAKVHIFSDKAFKDISSTDNPQGIMAIVKQKSYSVPDVIDAAGGNGMFIMAENLNDPGNLGTIIRTADACSFSGVFISSGSVDVYSPKVLRSTMGSVFHIPVIRNADICECAGFLKENGISMYAAHLGGEKTPYSFNFKKGCCFLIGNEANGLSGKALDLADEYIKIPMPGKAESLNASVAAAVLRSEAVRQRIDME